MKILLINLPYQGHVIPTLGLAAELIRLGCQVSYMLPYGWEDTVARSGADFLGYQNHRQLSEQIRNAFAAADAILPEFDLVLYEQFFFLGKHLAERHQKPAVRIFTAPVTNRALMDQFIQAKGPMHLFRHKWIARAFTKDIARGIPMQTDNWLDEIILNPPGLNLVYTLRQYQPFEADFPEPQYRFLGPSVYDRREPPFDLQTEGRPLVYISLGTVLRRQTAFFRLCAQAFRDADVDVVISAGQGFDQRKLKNIPPNVRFYPCVPQVEVLKMADAFVTHGGMNSISEALACKVPMVVIPFVSDQSVNARSMESLGVARQLSHSGLTEGVLRDAVLSVMRDPGIRSRLEDVAQLIARAPGNRGGAEMILDYYRQQTGSAPACGKRKNHGI